MALAWHNQRERAKAGLTAARARGRRGGRAKALTGKKLSIAQDLYNSPQNFIAEICQPSRSLKPRCTAISRPETETNDLGTAYVSMGKDEDQLPLHGLSLPFE